MNGSGENLGTAVDRLEAVTSLARTLSPAMTPLQRMRGLQLINARVARRKHLRTGGLALAILSLAAASAVVLLMVRSRAPTDANRGSIAYRIEGGEMGDGGYIRSDSPNGTRLRFEEGTELHLMAGARGRLSSIDSHGARLAIEEGEAEVKVTPRQGGRWLVDAGPFLITVRGTVFTASWDGAKERLDIKMTKGLVSVTGPLADGMLAVRAGQHLSVNVRKKEVLLQEIPSASPTDRTEAPGMAPGAVTGTSDPETGSETAPSGARAFHGADARGGAALRTTAGTGPHTWSAALVAGDLDGILRDAEKRGLRRVLAQSSSEDLAALADAARYRRRNDVAEQALLAERRRFPNSARASDSAFLLGRLEESRSSGETRALRWYDLYLKEAPFGAYSSEALGRKMTATERARGVPAAREVAEEYLRRFPNGTYAGAARALRQNVSQDPSQDPSQDLPNHR